MLLSINTFIHFQQYYLEQNLEQYLESRFLSIYGKFQKIKICQLFACRTILTRNTIKMKLSYVYVGTYKSLLH